MEIFKEINGYEGYYEVSNFGNVRSIERTVNGFKGVRIMKSRILSPGKQKSGYLYVTLSKDNSQKTFRIHRLVAETFISNPNNYSDVDHIDENKENNYAENLQWLSHSNNSSKSNKGICRKDNSMGNNPRARKVYCYEDGVLVKEYSCLKECSNDIKMNYSTARKKFRLGNVQIDNKIYTYEITT